MNILFPGTHGQFNIDDERLLETFIAQPGSEHPHAVNWYDPAFTQNAMRPKFNLESFYTTRELPSFLKYLLSSKLLFFGVAVASKSCMPAWDDRLQCNDLEEKRAGLRDS